MDKSATVHVSTRRPQSLELVQERYPSSMQRIAASLRLGQLRRSSKLRAGLLLVCMLLRPQGAWEVFRTIGGSVSVAMCNDGVGLCAELLTNIVYAAGLCCLDRLAEVRSRLLELLAAGRNGEQLRLSADSFRCKYGSIWLLQCTARR
eukprot:symbB.v1.2.012872.t1/scaffold875.1/size155714/21